jgi:hypothetical protein
MTRRSQGRSDRAVRVSFEITRLSERVMAEVYEQLLPIRQRRHRPGVPPSLRRNGTTDTPASPESSDPFAVCHVERGLGNRRG